MLFQTITDDGHLFVHGHFVDESGPFFQGYGLKHLSKNFFCRKDAVKFLISKMSFKEIKELPIKNIVAILGLPVEVPPSLARYEECVQIIGVIKTEVVLENVKAIRAVL